MIPDRLGRVRTSELLSTLTAGYWLFLALVPSRVGNEFGSFRALTDIAPPHFWVLFFATGILAQPAISRARRCRRFGLGVTTALIWFLIGLIQTQRMGLVGPVVWQMWIVSAVVCYASVLDYLGAGRAAAVYDASRRQRTDSGGASTWQTSHTPTSRPSRPSGRAPASGR